MSLDNERSYSLTDAKDLEMDLSGASDFMLKMNAVIRKLNRALDSMSCRKTLTLNHPMTIRTVKLPKI